MGLTMQVQALVKVAASMNKLHAWKIEDERLFKGSDFKSFFLFVNFNFIELSFNI